MLSWSTATELNNHGFEIERSADKTIWRTIGFKEGKGTTSETQQYSYSDILSGINSSRLYYRLKQLDFDGSFEYSKIVEAVVAPIDFALSQNYPNPFNPVTIINYQLPAKIFVSLKIYDVLGNEIAALVNEEKPPGKYEVEFDATNLTSGTYFYKLQAGNFVETKKMILLR
ncbi:MAG: T9SS type A sorting domain-containing protein [Ignavibacteria bacterium]|nr:T9SS type A sorting domain-containing protein [Ignavibacteria bacterium]MBT8382786.1 T9SS type A sorting domain-containing protein [Ignavibacteria bacterium]MBT8392673.1 T9SS type A sorting domain-containing protein [Ignavibacteria bacterium]NNJ52082.1 T9SS type A sorting domain-containing protein [Ignavibacteriaceae bacterium]NNL21992.1 T9SS type A sorting domain-containing protein [Ignavibacteriaceae bacterium]